MKAYLEKIYNARFFWLHLARMELKNKFRRSKLGILWTFVNPLCLTLIMSVVFSTVFHQEIVSYAPYILSGLLVWEIISSSFIGGSGLIVQNEPFIRQFNHPVTIYTLKSSLVYIFSFLLASISLFIWTIVSNPGYLVLGILCLPISCIIYFFLAWGASTIAAFTNTKYRDYPQMMALILQTVWYLSPVFFQESMFTQNELLHLWFQWNPLTHILALIREPFLYGRFPSLLNYAMSIGTLLVIGLIAIRINQKNARDIIFYI